MAKQNFIPKGLVRNDVNPSKTKGWFHLEKWLQTVLNRWGIALYKECCDYPTGVALVPMGTTAQRPVLGANESGFRYNTETHNFEAWDGSNWQVFLLD